MGRLLVAERETWYLGGGRSRSGADAVLVLGVFFRLDVSADMVFGRGVGWEGGKTSSALRGVVRRVDWVLGLETGAGGTDTLSACMGDVVGVAGFFNSDSVLGFEVVDGGVGTSSALALVFENAASAEWSEGSSGFGSGGWALSDSVTASAAARSAALEASWGVDGGGGGACDDAVGFADFTGPTSC